MSLLVCSFIRLFLCGFIYVWYIVWDGDFFFWTIIRVKLLVFWKIIWPSHAQNKNRFWWQIAVTSSKFFEKFLFTIVFINLLHYEGFHVKTNALICDCSWSSKPVTFTVAKVYLQTTCWATKAVASPTFILLPKTNFFGYIHMLWKKNWA